MSGAAASAAQPRAARLLVSQVWSGEVMDDMLVPAGETVTLGQDPGCTFTTPRLPMPPSFAILRPGSRGYVLTLGTSMTGQLKIGGEEMSVSDFVRRGHGGAEGIEGDFRATPVSEGDWGVIHLDGKGEHTFFFKFVREEPPLPPPLWVIGMLAPALAFAILFHGIFVTASFLLKDDGHSFLYPGGRELMTAYLVERPPEPEPEEEKDPNQGKKAGAEDLKEEVKKPAATKGKKGKAGGKGEKRAAAPDPQEGVPDAPKVALNRRENLKTMDEVAKMAGMEKAFGKALAGLQRDRAVVGDAGKGSGSGTGVGDDMDGTGTTRGAKKGGSGGGGKANEDVVTQKNMDTGGERAGKGNSGKKLKEEKVGFGDAGGDFTGGLSKADVEKVMRARKGSFRACYQQAVNRTPGLSGTVTLRFTIKDRGGAGQVTRANVVRGKSSLNNAAVENCILRKVQGLRFPAKGGAIVTGYPLVFSQG